MALPATAELVAPPSWRRIDFISDLHLADDTPRTFDSWAAYLRGTPADAVFILGDLFEAWPGDDARHSGFEARCADVLTSAARLRSLKLMVGNRDFMLGAEALDACGIGLLSDPTVLVAFGQRLLLSHGDALCLADVEYQQLRRTVRDPRWQAAALQHPLEQRRALARQYRAQSEQHQRGRASGVWFDIDRDTALQWMRAADAPVLVHGHTHRPGCDALAPGFSRQVLSDWDLDRSTPARAEVLRWHDGRLVRLTADAASASV